MFLKMFRAWSDAYCVFYTCIIWMKNKPKWFKYIHLQMSWFFLRTPWTIWRMWNYPSSHFYLCISKGHYWHSLQFPVSKMFACFEQEKSPKEVKISRRQSKLPLQSYFPNRHLEWPKVRHLSIKMRQVSNAVCFSRKLLQKQSSRCVL